MRTVSPLLNEQIGERHEQVEAIGRRFQSILRARRWRPGCFRARVRARTGCGRVAGLGVKEYAVAEKMVRCDDVAFALEDVGEQKRGVRVLGVEFEGVAIPHWPS